MYMQYMWLIIRYEIFNANVIGDLHPNQEGIVFRYIIET